MPNPQPARALGSYGRGSRTPWETAYQRVMPIASAKLKVLSYPVAYRTTTTRPPPATVRSAAKCYRNALSPPTSLYDQWLGSSIASSPYQTYFRLSTISRASSIIRFNLPRILRLSRNFQATQIAERTAHRSNRSSMPVPLMSRRVASCAIGLRNLSARFSICRSRW